MYKAYKARNGNRGTKFYPFDTLSHSDKDQAIIKVINYCGTVISSEQARHKRASIRVVDHDYSNKLVFEIMNRNDVIEAYAIDKRES